MPPKKGKKTKEKKAAKTGPAQPGQLVEKLLSVYEKLCVTIQGLPCTDLCGAMRKCIEGNRLLVRFILQEDRAVIGARPLMNVEPLLQALRDARYVFIQELRVWNVIMPYEKVASVVHVYDDDEYIYFQSLLLEKRIYELRILELVDCLVEADSLRRLAPSVTICSTLTNLTLDHNEFGDEGCLKLCNGLHGNRTLLSLSMIFCDLRVDSGAILGKLIAKSAIRDVYLDGNSLESEGTMDLVQALADRAELEHFEREEPTKRSMDDEAVTAISSLKAKEQGYSISRTESPGAVDSDTGSKKSSIKKKKGKKKNKSKEPPGPPAVGPWIRRLHLADNGIDAMGPTGLIGPITCTQLLGTLLEHSTFLEELDLDDNLIGDLAGRQILAALEARAAGGLPSVKMRTTHRMKSDTLNGIFKLGAGLKKKKKKGRKKKKK